MVYLSFYKKKKEFFKACSSYFFVFTDFPRFQGPAVVMYQSVEKCFRIQLRAASIHKISWSLGGLDPSSIFIGSAGASDRYADISAWLEPWDPITQCKRGE